MLSAFITKIRNKDGRIPAFIHKRAKAVLAFNMPPIRIIYSPLLTLRKCFSSVFTWIMQKFVNEPMFKARCKNIGPGFRIHKGFPYFSSNIQFHLGKNVSFDGKNSFDSSSTYPDPTLVVGDNTYIGHGTTISVGKRVEIGSNCLIAGNVFICDNNGHPLAPNMRHKKVSPEDIAPVCIESNVWIGTGAFVGKGVTIGTGTIVGANSVVKTSVQENSIVTGNPAKTVKLFSPEQIV